MVPGNRKSVALPIAPPHHLKILILQYNLLCFSLFSSFSLWKNLENVVLSLLTMKNNQFHREISSPSPLSTKKTQTYTRHIHTMKHRSSLLLMQTIPRIKAISDRVHINDTTRFSHTTELSSMQLEIQTRCPVTKWAETCRAGAVTATFRPHSFPRVSTNHCPQALRKCSHYCRPYRAVWHAGSRVQRRGRQCCWEMPEVGSAQPVYISTQHLLQGIKFSHHL